MIVVTAQVLRHIFAGIPLENMTKRRPTVIEAMAEKTPKSKHGRPRRSLNQPRDIEMMEMYRQGMTLAAIGTHYNVSRQRIDQILKLHGIGRLDGGQSLHTFLATHDTVAKLRAKNEAQEQRIFARTGMTLDQWKAHSAEWGNDNDPTSPYHKFKSQRNNAQNKRGIAWGMTFAQWWQLWQESGKWAERGRGNGYCMARWGDSGGYEIGNVEICRGNQNVADSFITKPSADRKKYTPHELLARRLNILWLHEQGWNRTRIVFILEATEPMVRRALRDMP
jgi:hypothetical protein